MAEVLNNQGRRRDPPRLFTNLVCGLCLAALLAAAVFTPSSLPSLKICWFARLTDLPCPGCGLTRSVCAIAHGRFADAWQFHPFGYFFFAVFLTGAAGPLISLLFPNFEGRVLKTRVLLVLPVCLVVSLIIFGVCRLLVVVL